MKLTTYKGTDIDVDIDGRFSAIVNGRRVEDRTCSKIRSAIDKAEPAVAVLRVGGTYPALSTETVLKSEMAWIERNATEGVAERYAELDQAILDQWEGLVRLQYDQRRLLDSQHRDEQKALLSKLPRLPIERLHTLLEADRLAKLNRK